MSMLHIVLVEPEIPQNTGNIARTCAATGALLHLILFSKIKIPEKLQGLIKKAAACSFGIYLLNTQPAIWKLTDGRFAAYGTGPLILILLVVAANVVVFMAGGILIDLALYALSPFRKRQALRRK